MTTTVDLSITSVVFDSPLTAGEDLSVTVNYDVSLTDDTSGDPVADTDAVSDVDIKLYYIEDDGGFPSTRAELLTAIGTQGATALATLTEADALQDGEQSLAGTVTWADLLVEITNTAALTGKIYAIVDDFTLEAGADAAAAAGDNDVGSADLTTEASDLQISVSLESTDSIAVGDSVKVNWTADNAGDADAEDAVVNFYWTEDDGSSNAVLLDTEDFDLNGGSDRSGSFNVSYAALIAAIEAGNGGTDGGVIVARIDEGDTVEEVLNEGNNSDTTAQLTFDNVASTPDLLVENLRISDTDLAYGEDLTIRVAFGNDDDTGYADASGVELKVYDADDDGLIHTEVLGAVELGSFDYNYVFDVAFADLAAEGDGDFGVYVTIDGAEADVDGSNEQTATIAITVDETENLPDLSYTASTADVGVVADINGNYSGVSVGTDLVWDLSIQNTGDLNAYNVTTTFYAFEDIGGDGLADDGEVIVTLGTDDNFTVDAGETRTGEGDRFDYDDLKDALGDLDTGFYFYATVATEDGVTDSDTGNNSSTPFQVTWAKEVADLKVNDLTVRGFDSVAGQKDLAYEDDLYVRLEVENEGTINYAAATTTYYIDTDGTLNIDANGDSTDASTTKIGTDSHGNLKAGEVDGYEPFTITWDDHLSAYEGQTVYLFAKINAAGTDEDDDSDNLSSSVKIVVDDAPTPANLSLTWGFAGGDDTVSPNDPLIIEATVSNTGETAARSVKTYYYYHADETALAHDATDDDISTLLGVDNNGYLAAGEVDADEGLKIKFSDFGLDADDADGVIYAVVKAGDTEMHRETVPTTVEVDAPEAADVGYDSFTITGGNSLATGAKVEVNVELTNSGELRSDNMKTKFFWSLDNSYDDDGTDKQLDAEGHGGIDGGETLAESESFKFDTIAQYGDGDVSGTQGFILAVLFADDVATGDVEAINFDFASGAHAVAPDYTVTAIAADVTANELAAGDQLRVDYTVSNIGLADGEGETTFYWSTTDDLTTGTVVELGSDDNYRLNSGEVDDNEVFKITYSSLLSKLDAAGLSVDNGDPTLTGFLLAEIDDTGDADDTNNVLSQALDIDIYDGPDLQLTDETLNDLSLDDHDKLVFNFTASNDGDVDVKARTKFYWSTDGDTDTADDTYLELDGQGTLVAGGSKAQAETFSYSQLVTANGGTGNGYLVAVIEETDDGTTHDSFVSAQITLEVIV